MTYKDYLAHYGIKKMKWGKRNGPPYPLTDLQRSAEEVRENPTSISAKRLARIGENSRFNRTGAIGGTIGKSRSEGVKNDSKKEDGKTYAPDIKESRLTKFADKYKAQREPNMVSKGVASGSSGEKSTSKKSSSGLTAEEKAKREAERQQDRAEKKARQAQRDAERAQDRAEKKARQEKADREKEEEKAKKAAEKEAEAKRKEEERAEKKARQAQRDKEHEEDRAYKLAERERKEKERAEKAAAKVQSELDKAEKTVSSSSSSGKKLNTDKKRLTRFNRSVFESFDSMDEIKKASPESIINAQSKVISYLRSALARGGSSDSNGNINYKQEYKKYRKVMSWLRSQGF